MSDLAGWLIEHQDEPFVQLEMPPPIALAVAKLLEGSGFEMHPMPTAGEGIPKAIVVPKSHLLNALLQAMVAMEESEHLQDCPECRVGKHENCPGDTWDDRRDELATCPCHARGHRDVVERTVHEVLETDVWPSSEDLEKLTGFRRHPITDFPPGTDLP